MIDKKSLFTVSILMILLSCSFIDAVTWGSNAAGISSVGLREWFNFSSQLAAINPTQNNLTIYTGTPVLNATSGIALYDNFGAYFDGVNDAYKLASNGEEGVFNLSSGQDYTINFWFYSFDDDDYMYLMSKGSNAPAGWDIVQNNVENKIYYRQGSNLPATSSPLAWKFVSLTLNSTTTCFYINGLLANCTGQLYASSTNTAFMIGGAVDAGNLYGHFMIDELNFWNRSLNSSDIAALYNGGTGLSYDSILKQGIITLNSPIDHFNTTISSIVFNTSIVTYGANITNISLWTNTSGTWKRNQTMASLGLSDNKNFTLTNLPDAKYIWGIEACDSDGACGFSSNRTFTIDIPPNMTINYPQSSSSKAISINISIADDKEPSYCYYNISRGASLEIANTALNVSQFPNLISNNTVSSYGDYVIHAWCNDTNNNPAYNSKSFSISDSGSGNTGGGGGGGYIAEVLQGVKKAICEPTIEPLNVAWNNFKTSKDLKNFVILWHAFFDNSICESGASILGV